MYSACYKSRIVVELSSDTMNSLSGGTRKQKKKIIIKQYKRKKWQANRRMFVRPLVVVGLALLAPGAFWRKRPLEQPNDFVGRTINPADVFNTLFKHGCQPRPFGPPTCYHTFYRVVTIARQLLSALGPFIVHTPPSPPSTTLPIRLSVSHLRTMAIVEQSTIHIPSVHTCANNR